MPARFSTFSVTSAGPVSMMQGSEPMEAKARMRARGFRPCDLPASLVPSSTAAAPSTMPRRIAGVMDVVELLDLRIALLRHRIEAREFAQLRERRLERRQRLHRRIGAHMLVMVEDGLAENVLHRHDRLLEIAVLPRIRRALLAFDRIGVDVVAREAVERRDQIGADALRREIGLDRDLRIDRPRRRPMRPCRRGSWIRRRRRWSCPTGRT